MEDAADAVISEATDAAPDAASAVADAAAGLELPSLDLPLPAIGALVLLAAGAAFVSGKSGGDEAPAAEESAPTPAAAAPAAAPEPEPVAGDDVSIPYDAAARLAYDKAGAPGDYAAFKTKYEADAVADVKAKQ